MKNRLAKGLVVGIAAIGLLLGSNPAQAGSLTWKDPAGDATQLGLADGGPNDPAFDITAVTISNDGGTLKWSVDIPEMAAGTPDLSTGYNLRFAFTHGGATYWFKVAEDLTGASTFALSATETGATNLPCEKCEVKFDREGKKVALNVPLASLEKALKAQEGAAPLAGAEWTGLYVIAQRPLSVPGAGGATLTADQADAPTGSTLAF